MMKVYSIAIGNFSIPLKKDQKKVLEIIKEETKGLIGIVPQYPDGTLILFDTLNGAKECRNILKAEQVMTGYNIVEFDFENDVRELKNGKVVA